MRSIAYGSLIGCFSLLAGCGPVSPKTYLDWGVMDHNDEAKSSEPLRASLPVSDFKAGQVSAPLRSFLWPVKGKISKNYDMKSRPQSAGLSITAAGAQAIIASAPGDVVFSGDELKSYGHLVLIRHEKGYVTAYSQKTPFIVHKGQSVKAGEIIGYTPNDESAEVNFEIRHNVEPIDPMIFLGRVGPSLQKQSQW